MVVVEVLLRIFDPLHFEVALGQTGMCLHLLEFQGVLTVLLFSQFLGLPHHFFLDSLLQFLQILFLVVDAFLKLSLHVVQFPYLVGYPRLALVLPRPLTDVEGAVVGLEGFLEVKLHLLLCLLDVYLDQLFTDEVHHLSTLLLVVDRARTVERFLQNLYGPLVLLHLVVALAQTQSGSQLELVVLLETGATLA